MSGSVQRILPFTPPVPGQVFENTPAGPNLIEKSNVPIAVDKTVVTPSIIALRPEGLTSQLTGESEEEFNHRNALLWRQSVVSDVVIAHPVKDSSSRQVAASIRAPPLPPIPSETYAASLVNRSGYYRDYMRPTVSRSLALSADPYLASESRLIGGYQGYPTTQTIAYTQPRLVADRASLLAPPPLLSDPLFQQTPIGPRYALPTAAWQNRVRDQRYLSEQPFASSLRFGSPLAASIPTATPQPSVTQTSVLRSAAPLLVPSVSGYPYVSGGLPYSGALPY